ncbi:MAG: hypothetical protein HY001_03450 [Candidatus Portnoybacteria bacterium]|nr:hypothetical protein [Candidatus Portnoybacteria bacterium]
MALLIIWFILFGLIILSLLSNGSIPLGIPLIAWGLVVIFKGKEKYGNYKDNQEKNRRDEKLKLNNQAEEEAQKGTAFSSGRVEREQIIREDFEYKRRKLKRKFHVDLISTLFLK